MREGFETMNLHPLTFDPASLDVGTTLIGHVFGIEIGEDRNGGECLLYAVKSLETTKAVDPLSRRVVDAAAGLAVRVVVTPALSRIRAMIPAVPFGMEGGEANDLFPCFLFRVVQLGDGPRTLVVARNPVLNTTRGMFTAPSAAPPLALDAVAAAASAATPAPAAAPTA